MPYIVSPEVQKGLLELPETGMGYQQVSVPSITKRNSDEYFVILNAYLVLETHGFMSRWLSTEELDYLSHEMSRLSGQPMLPFYETGAIELEVGIDEFPCSLQDIRVLGGNSYPAKTQSDEKFVRFSAFENDFRFIDNGARIRPGTYFTTKREARQVLSGLMAVSRYALPNPSPAIYRTDFTFSNIEDIVCGTVEPNYHQSGGGTEIRVDSPGNANLRSFKARKIAER